MISVCIATYNGGLFLKMQLQSILSQLSLNDEIIISDDGSTDNTLEIIHSMNDDRIKFFRHEKKLLNHRSKYHIYTSVNFENALHKAQGDYIFLADQDDIWCDRKVEKIKQLLSKEGNILVVSNLSIIDSENNIIEPILFKKKPIKESVILNILKTPFFGCCMAFKRELLNYILPFPNNLILHDNWIGLIAHHFGNIEYISEPLILYRRHQNNVSHNKGKSENPIWYKIYYRIELYFKYRKRINEIHSENSEVKFI